MLSNFIIFRIYLCIAITVLLPICYFITIELVNQILYYLIYLKAYVFMQVDNVNEYDINFLVNYFLTRKQWFKCITMLQFSNYYNIISTYKLLGMCFHKLSYYTIARYYYVKALKNENDIIVLQNLGLVCRDLKDYKMMREICDKIRSIDSDNSVLLELSL
jgi:tetratricopeptide (TPR) repeat protein